MCTRLPAMESKKQFNFIQNTAFPFRFRGSIKVLVSEFKRDYGIEVAASIVLGMVHYALGGICMALCAFYILIEDRDIHVYINSIASILFMAEGILSLNPWSGWATPLKPQHQKCVHTMCHVIGFGFSMSGSILVIYNYYENTVHCFTGILALGFEISALISGLLSLFGAPKWFIALHIILGITSFMLYMVSIIYAIADTYYATWIGVAGDIVLIVMVACCAITIVFSVILKLAVKLVNKEF